MEIVSAYVKPVCTLPDGQFDGGVFDLSGLPIERGLHRRSRENNVHAPRRVASDEIKSAEVNHALHIYAGFMFNHFGHFLLESLGRIWAARIDEGKEASVLYIPVWGAINCNNLDHYMGGTLKELGINSKRIVLLSKPTLFTRLILPDQLYGFHHMQGVDNRFLEMLRAAHIEADASVSTKSIYVSRSKLDIKLGRVAGEEKFEDYMASEGYEIIYPEQLPFPEQLTLYRRAERIVFSEGSAIHAAMLFANTKAKISVILRRPNTIGWVRRFFSSIGLDVDTIDCVKRHDTCGLASNMGVSIVDFLAVSERLAQSGFVHRVFTQWPSLSAVAVSAHYRQYLTRVERETGFVAPAEILTGYAGVAS